jgi:hypothetical protein
MIFAEQSDFDKIKSIFYKHRKWFPHVRTDYMMRMIGKKTTYIRRRCAYNLSSL